MSTSYTIRELMDLTGLSRSTIHRHLKSKNILAVAMSGTAKLYPEDTLKSLENDHISPRLTYSNPFQDLRGLELRVRNIEIQMLTLNPEEE